MDKVKKILILKEFLGFDISKKVDNNRKKGIYEIPSTWYS